MRIFFVTAIVSIVAVACGGHGLSRQLTPHPSVTELATTIATAQPSPVGLVAGPRRLAFISDRDGPYRLYTMNADGADIRRLSDQPVEPLPFSVSRDGTQIAAAAGEDGVSGQPLHLVRIDVAGGATTPIGVAPAYWEVLFPALYWRADDAAIPVLNYDICYEFPPGGGSVRVADLETCREAVNRAEGTDGRWAAIAGDSLLLGKDTGYAGARKIDAVVPASEKGGDFAGLAYEALLTSGFWRPLWSPDGSQIAYFDGDAASGQRGIAVIPAGGGASRLLVPADAVLIPEAWSEDGRTIYFSDLEQEWTIKAVDVATGQSRIVVGGDGHPYRYPRQVIDAPAPARQPSLPVERSQQGTNAPGAGPSG